MSVSYIIYKYCELELNVSRLNGCLKKYYFSYFSLIEYKTNE